jgi:hypothetical protein
MLSECCGLAVKELFEHLQRMLEWSEAHSAFAWRCVCLANRLRN